MKLQFDPNQAYQNQAISAITDAFEGRAMSRRALDFTFKSKDLPG